MRFVLALLILLPVSAMAQSIPNSNSQISYPLAWWNDGQWRLAWQAKTDVTNGTLTTPAISGGTINNSIVGGTTPAAGTFTSATATGAVSGATYSTATNCSSGASPAVCGAAASGGGAVPTGANPTLVVNTTAVTAGSQIQLTPDETLGTKLTVTCNTTLTTQGPLVVTARTAGTSFTVAVDATVATNPVCFNWTIIN